MPESRICSFGRWISSHDWLEVFQARDVNAQCTAFYRTLHTAIDLHFPLRKAKIHSNDRDWITPKVKLLMKKRQKAFHKNEREKWKRLRNRVMREIEKAKKEYYCTRIQKLKNSNPSSWYREIRILTGQRNEHPSIDIPGLLTNDPSQAANAINDHFSNIASDLNPLNTESLPAYLPAPSPCPILQPWEVHKALAKIKQRSAGGPDGISARLIKEFSVELATPLTHILNTSFQQVIAPDQWKRATVIPIPKTTPPTIEKLRPISLTDHFAKVAEGFMVKWFLEDLTPKVDPNQFGNRKHHSTSHCLINVLHLLFANAEIPKSTSSVLITDFTKAFDRIDHTISISKMITQGIRPSVIAWIANFLTGRRQNVRYQDTLSDWSSIHAGVPQGTRLGPPIFLSMINDAAPPSSIKAFKYVDDMTFVESRRSSQPSNMQEAVSSLSRWTSENKMSLNPSKCCIMNVTFSKNPPVPPEIFIDDHRLQCVDNVKLLGTLIQSDLKWDSNVNDILRRANGKLHMLRLLKRHFLPCQDLITVYRSYIRPICEYGCPVWHGGLTVKQSSSLESVQKRALRIILGNQFSSYDDALNICNLTSLSERRENLCLSFMKKTLSKTNQFQEYLPPPPPRKSLRNPKKLTDIKCKTNRMQNSAIPYLINLINST